MTTIDIKLTEREWCLVLAALLSAEDAPQAFRCGLEAIMQPPATNLELDQLGDWITTALGL